MPQQSKGFGVIPDRVRDIANKDIAPMGTSVGEMEGLAKASALGKAHFGRIAGLSDQAGSYVEKFAQLNQSLGKAEAFIKDYVTALNGAMAKTEDGDARAGQTLPTDRKA